MYSKIIILALSVIGLSSCKVSQQMVQDSSAWYNIAIAEDVEIYVDTISIKHVNATVYATEKRIYTTADAKQKYVDKIRDTYTKLGKPDKAGRWNDFSYCIYQCLYECTNKRFRILSIEDFDSTGKRIAKTTPPKDKITWLDVEAETVGDYTFFYICDY